MKSLPHAAKWQPVRRHISWIRRLRLRTLRRREKGCGLRLRYRNFGRRPSVTSLAIALNFSLLIRSSIRNLNSQLHSRRQREPVAGSVNRALLPSPRPPDPQRDGRRGSVIGPGASAGISACSPVDGRTPVDVVRTFRTRQVRIEGGSHVAVTRRSLPARTGATAEQDVEVSGRVSPNRPVGVPPKPERITIAESAPGTHTTIRFHSVYREHQQVSRSFVVSTTRRLQPVTPTTGATEAIGRVMGRRPGHVEAPSRQTGKPPVRQITQGDRDRREPRDRVEIQPLIVRRPARAVSPQARRSVRDVPSLVVRKRTAVAQTGTEKPSVTEERVLRRRIIETVERTVVEAIDRRLKPDSRLGRRLTGQMRSQLYQDLVFERERMGVA